MPKDNQFRLPFIFASIDVEAAHGRNPFDQMILGRTDDGQHWGVFQIAEILEKFGGTGTFFVDVYEDVLWGKTRMKKLCQDLVARGHDVQLHTHPSWRHDPRDSDALNDLKAKQCRFPPEKDLMAKLTLDEQTAMIAEGKALLEEWTDCEVIAHRSGGYSVNEDTITALERNDIYIDSSMNGSHANSKVNWSKNLPVGKGEMVELPVTYYRLLASHAVPRLFQRLMKTDIDSTPLWMLKDLTNQFEARGIGILHLFMHSFTLLDTAPDFSSIRQHKIRCRRLNDYLAFLAKNGWTVGGVKELTSQEGWRKKVLQGQDGVPDYRDLDFLTNLVKLRLKREIKLRTKRLRA